MRIIITENDAVELTFGDITIDLTVKRANPTPNPKPVAATKATKVARKRGRGRGKSEAEKLTPNDRQLALAWAEAERMVKHHRLTNAAVLGWVDAGKPRVRVST